MLASALRVAGFRVVTADSAKGAREALAEGDVAVAVIDLMLRSDGGTHGLELAREVRAAYPLTRVMLTSAYHLSARQLERVDCGVSGFIPKPYDVGEVVEFLRTKLSGPPSSRRLLSAPPPYAPRPTEDARGEPSGIKRRPDAPVIALASGDRARSRKLN